MSGNDVVSQYPKPEELFDEKFISKYRGKQPKWGFNGLGYIVYKRTYARRKEDGTKEEWWETVKRCIEGSQSIGACYTKDEARRLFDYMFNLKGNMAGRMLWQLGTGATERFGGNSLLNCWFTTITDVESFCFLFENLMLGGGVGFSIKKEHVHELPKVKRDVSVQHQKTNDADFIVPDSREGWVQLLRHVLNAYFHTGEGFTYSTVLIRGKGEPIHTFGGTASGPGILVHGIEEISKILDERQGKKLRSIDALDICNIIGSIVVAGNVRRSSEVALGDPDDILFLRAKRWDKRNIPNHRAMSNNSIYIDSPEYIMPEVWSGYKGNGEPYGFINLDLIQNYGRHRDKKKDTAEGGNPCMEIPLEDGECCNLSEIYMNNIETYDEMVDVAKLLYKTQKAVASLPFIHKKTEEVVHRNMRLGLGVTGICQSYDKLDWLDPAYRELRSYDKEWSKHRGWNQSIRLTTVKPSGTLSLLGGATPGGHPGYSRYYIRRVRISADDPLVEYCENLGCKIEFVQNFDGSPDHTTVVVEFPCYLGDEAIIAEEMGAIAQLYLVERLQRDWADNSVSVTVYYTLDELDDIKTYMNERFMDKLKTVSFLLHQDHGFAQAPYEEIDQDHYNKLSENMNPVEMISNLGDEQVVEECEGGACPVK